MEGRFLVNAARFWNEKGIIRAAFTRRKHRAAFPCKRGKRGGEGEAVVSGSKAGGDAVVDGVKPLLTGAGYGGGAEDGFGLL